MSDFHRQWPTCWKELADEPQRLTHHTDNRHFAARIRRVGQLVVGTSTDEHRGRLRDLAPHLRDWIADTRTLRQARDYLARRGGRAPGPDGVRYRDLNDRETWQWMRFCRAALRSGAYQPGPERVVHVPKASGSGTRPLVLQNITDRVVQRAAVEILQPLLDPLFDARSFGFRPGRGVRQALAAADATAAASGMWWWVTADIAVAFQAVPVARLLQVVRHYLPDDGLIDWIGRMLGGSQLPGLRQGGPLSPLLLNLYLHHVLDRWWRANFPNVALIRYADDLLLLCRSEADAVAAHAALERRLRDIGMPLKPVPATAAVCDLSNPRPARWLGFRIVRGEKRLRIRLGGSAWFNLRRQLGRAHDAPNAPLAAAAVIRGWLGAVGPAYAEARFDRAYPRLVKAAAAEGFEEVPPRETVRQWWQAAYARWCRDRKRAAGPGAKTAAV